jgi:uncharacterized DUF497 family protein
MSFNLNLLVVSHSFLERAGIIRIISARKATKKEIVIKMELNVFYIFRRTV